MTDFNTKDGTNLGPSRIWTSPTAYALYENPIRIAEGAPNAPRIQTDALDTGVVTEAKIAASAVTEGKISARNVTTTRIGLQAVTPAEISKANTGVTSSFSGNEIITIPAGIRYYLPHSDIIIEVNIGGTWRTGAFGLIISDGTSFRARNTSAVPNTTYYVRYD